MNYQHQDLKNGGWKKLNICQKMANIGSEVERAIIWKNKNNLDYSKLAFYRSLELISLTIEEEKNYYRLRELTRLREVLVDYFFGENIYKSSESAWHKFFYPFNFAARNKEHSL